MDSEKVVVALLLIVIILSVATIAVTMNLSVDKASSSVNPKDFVDVNHANVGLMISAPPTKDGGET